MNVILLKDYSSDYEEVLQSHGYNVKFKPVLSSKSVNDARIKHLFSSSPLEQNYRGVIATSQKAFESINGIREHIHEEWLALETWVVGPKTCDFASSLGFTNIRGKESGNAKALAQEIISKHSSLIEASGVYLFLVGDKSRATLIDSLEEAKFKVDTVQVYETQNVSIDSMSLVGSIVVVFSPSGVASLEPSIESISTFQHVNNIQWISIGPTTFQALLEKGISSIQAETPSPHGVLNAITELQS